jgi:hypothetical protein
MPTPRIYDTIAARLHGWRTLAAIGFFFFLLLTALCIVAVRARFLPLSPLLSASMVLFFSLSAWSGGVYLLCDWFDPEKGYLTTLVRPKPGFQETPRIRSLAQWASAVFLDLVFLAAAALTLGAAALTFSALSRALA